jgi:hypothetical protein
MHDTIGYYTGPDSGDSQYIENHGLAHYVVGEDDGEWEQLVDDEFFTAHCNGANRRAIGVEFSRTYAGQELTDWQVYALSQLQQDFYARHWIPVVYLNPDTTAYASIWVNGGGYEGWISHCNVRTDDSSQQHFDYIQYADWQKAMQPQGDDMPFTQWPVGDVLAFAKFIQEQVGHAMKDRMGAGDNLFEYAAWFQEQVKNAQD